MASVSDISRLITELFEMVISYVKNQTIVPLKRLIRYVGLGMVGSLFVSIGLFLGSIGFLRYLQTLSPFDDTFSFAPYLLVIVVDICIMGVLFAIMTSSSLIKNRKTKTRS